MTDTIGREIVIADRKLFELTVACKRVGDLLPDSRSEDKAYYADALNCIENVQNIIAQKMSESRNNNDILDSANVSAVQENQNFKQSIAFNVKKPVINAVSAVEENQSFKQNMAFFGGKSLNLAETANVAGNEETVSAALGT